MPSLIEDPLVEDDERSQEMMIAWRYQSLPKFKVFPLIMLPLQFYEYYSHLLAINLDIGLTLHAKWSLKEYLQ